MNELVEQIMKVINKPPPQPRLKKSERVVIPTYDCPLPDQPNDMTDAEWLVLCHLAHSDIVKEVPSK